MGKPKIVLADTDESYVAPLETKFLNELSDRMDFAIITDVDYLGEFFSTPQQVDILIISEHLYDPLFLKHDIAHIFILVENQKESGAVNENVSTIFKYSSLKELYSRIMTVCSSSVKMESITPDDTKVILLYSIPGGTGKTTLALGMSSCIAQNFKKVLYVNADRINTFQLRLKDSKALPVNVAAGLRGNYVNAYEILHDWIQNEGFDYLPPFSSALSTLGIEYTLYKEFIRRAKAKKCYDYIVVDADQILDIEKSEMIAEADKVLILTNQEKNSVMATNLIKKNINCNDSEKFFYICNKYKKDEYNALENNAEFSFQVDEYVNFTLNIDTMPTEDIGRLHDIQKVTFLVL